MVDIPNQPDPLTYGPPPAADGDPPAYLFDWDPAEGDFVLRRAMTESHPRSEVEAAVATYLEHREALDRGEAEWGTVARFFTDDAVFIDAAWGRHDGPEAIATMMTAAMAGLDGFSYPTDVVAIEGDDV